MLRHVLGKLESRKPANSCFKGLSCVAWLPKRMITSKNFKKNHSCRPNVSLFGISKIVGHLLWRLVEKGATLEKISDVRHDVIFAG